MTYMSVMRSSGSQFDLSNRTQLSRACRVVFDELSKHFLSAYYLINILAPSLEFSATSAGIKQTSEDVFV